MLTNLCRKRDYYISLASSFEAKLVGFCVSLYGDNNRDNRYLILIYVKITFGCEILITKLKRN